MAQTTPVSIMWAPYIRISLLKRLVAFARSTFVMLVSDSLLVWKLGLKGRNANEDVEGPFYIPGAPQRAVGDGKMVLASPELMQRDGPFLLQLSVRDSSEEPIPHATLDCWQADSHGQYYFASWTLRGTVRTDGLGRAELLTVRPADYAAPLLGTRPGHVHMKVSAPSKGAYKELTTQVYVCPANEAGYLRKDSLTNSIRASPHQNVATCWSLPDANGGELYHELPALPAEDVEAAQSVKWWNEKLKEQGIEREVRAFGRHELTLTRV